MAFKISNLFKRKKNDIDITKLFTFGGETIISQNATSFSCIDLICSSFANLSGHFYSYEERKAIREHPLSILLKNPNIDEDRFTFFYNSAKDYYGSGNVYWYKSDIDKEIVSLFRLNSTSVKIKRDPTTNQKIFSYNGQDYTSENIIHIPSRFGYDGLKGKSIFDECNQIFNTVNDIDSYVNNTFNSSAGKRLIIDISKEYPNATNEQIDRLKELFLQNYAGVKNAGRPLIKSGKIDYDVVDSELRDNRSTQLIENRQFGEKEIAKLFSIPLSFLNGDIKGDLESLYTFFLEGAIRPLAVTFENAINRLLPLYERESVFFEFDYSSLMKTSLQTRIDSYTKQLNNSILSPNEIRRKENLPEIEAGDTLFVPANLMPLKKEIIDSYMSSAKLKQQELNTESPNTIGSHSNLGDDKGI